MHGPTRRLVERLGGGQVFGGTRSSDGQQFDERVEKVAARALSAPRDALRLDVLDDDLLPLVAEGVRTGEFHSGQQIFTNAYLHLPAELRREVRDAGFQDAQVFNIEGPGALVPDFEERWADPARRRVLMETARLVESDESLGGAGHLLCVAVAGPVDRATVTSAAAACRGAMSTARHPWGRPGGG